MSNPSNAPTGEAAAFSRNVLTKAATLANDENRLYGEPGGLLAYEFHRAKPAGGRLEDFAADKLRLMADAVANTRDLPAALAQVAKVLVQISMLQRAESHPAEESEEERQNPIPGFLRGGTFRTKDPAANDPATSPLDPDRTGE